MLNKVEPLRNELDSLEAEAQVNIQKNEEVQKLIHDLEASIARYKEEYAILISQAQAIKADLAAVEGKVGRSVALLKSLSSENERWDGSSESFKSQMATIIGDVLLTSAFQAYAGYFDQHMRQNLFTTWSTHLQQANVVFKGDLARIEVSARCRNKNPYWQNSQLILPKT